MEAEVARERQAKMALFINRMVDILPDESISDVAVSELCSHFVR